MPDSFSKWFYQFLLLPALYENCSCSLTRFGIKTFFNLEPIKYNFYFLKSEFKFIRGLWVYGKLGYGGFFVCYARMCTRLLALTCYHKHH